MALFLQNSSCDISLVKGILSGGYFESFTHQAQPRRPTHLGVCECVRDISEKRSEGERTFFDISESEERIRFPVPLSKVFIPRSGVRFHLCHVEIPSEGLVCLC